MKALTLTRTRYAESDDYRAELIHAIQALGDGRQRWPEALELIEELRRSAQARYGADHLDHGRVALLTGHVMRNLKRNEESLAAYRRALDLIRRFGGESNPELVVAQMGVAYGLKALGRHEENAAAIAEVRRLYEEHHKGTPIVDKDIVEFERQIRK